MTEIFRELSDEEAIALVLAGDGDAYTPLVERYYHPLFRHALYIVKNAETAEDFLQEALAAAYFNLSRLRDRTKSYAWVRRAVERRCFNWLTRRRETEALTEELALTIASDRPTPEEELLSAERSSAVRTALAGLPEHLRETARLYFLDGRKQGDIAERLHIPLGTVKRRIHDAKLQLQRELEPMNEKTNEAVVSEGYLDALRERIAQLEAAKKAEGDAVHEAFSLIDAHRDDPEIAQYERSLMNLAYYGDGVTPKDRKRVVEQDEIVERALRLNDPHLLEEILTDSLNNWDISREGSDRGLAQLDALLDRMRTMPESHAKHTVMGKLMLWGHFCSQLTVYKDFPKARAALRQVIAEMAPHVLLCEDPTEARWYREGYRAAGVVHGGLYAGVGGGEGHGHDRGPGRYGGPAVLRGGHVSGDSQGRKSAAYPSAGPAIPWHRAWLVQFQRAAGLRRAGMGLVLGRSSLSPRRPHRGKNGGTYRQQAPE